MHQRTYQIGAHRTRPINSVTCQFGCHRTRPIICNVSIWRSSNTTYQFCNVSIWRSSNTTTKLVRLQASLGESCQSNTNGCKHALKPSPKELQGVASPPLPSCAPQGVMQCSGSIDHWGMLQDPLWLPCPPQPQQCCCACQAGSTARQLASLLVGPCQWATEQAPIVHCLLKARGVAQHHMAHIGHPAPHNMAALPPQSKHHHPVVGAQGLAEACNRGPCLLGRSKCGGSICHTVPLAPHPVQLGLQFLLESSNDHPKFAE